MSAMPTFQSFHARTIFAAALALTACRSQDGPPNKDPVPPSLDVYIAADDSGSCVLCHPRQFREWAGSSHNYGQGLDPGYQSLEITGNYYTAYRLGQPLFRRTVLCITCHAPTVGGFKLDKDGVDRLNPNALQRFDPDAKRDLRYPEASSDEALLEPPFRAAEMQSEVVNDPGMTMEQIVARRRINFQGISCDTCHKVGRPFDDLADDDYNLVCREKTAECAARLREACNQTDDPYCRRITRDQHHEGEDRFDFGIANFALSIIRQGVTRFGPFPVGHVATNIAHGVSHGEGEAAQNYHVEFPGQPADVRPFIKTSQFCGACHDVRLPADSLKTPDKVEIEPIHNEPFIRLENLFTEFFISPLNLHPSADPRDNPFIDDNGNPKRIVCQDCHMSLFPYAPPGTFPGEYTAADSDCDAEGRCGPTIAVDQVDGMPVTTNNLKVVRRPRVTTHYMTGVDVALGHLKPDPELIGIPEDQIPAAYQLPYQLAPEDDRSPEYDVPFSLDARREQQLKNAATISLAGNPDMIDPADRDCHDGVCCDAEGNCNLGVKAWIMNINGGHNVSAGFSQERQVWVELTVQDLGRRDAAGIPEVVDCVGGDLADLYRDETLVDGRYPRWSPRSHDAVSATEVFNRFYGVTRNAQGEEEEDHEHICRGFSGHLMDKPHFETHELTGDGSLHDEDIFLHRIGNTLPELEDGRYLVSWHVLDYGTPLDNFGADPIGARVDRPDQFHVAGNSAYACELSKEEPNPAFADYPVVVYDPRTDRTETVAMGGLKLKHRVTDTPDERLEILYPFPEYAPLLPHIKDGHLEPGHRAGLAYPTNIFYRICGCPQAGDKSCEGPESVPGVEGAEHAQMPWIMTYPTLPSAMQAQDPDKYPFAADREYFAPILTGLGFPGGTPSTEAFTFIPFNSNHMPNNRSLRYFRPQRHYWDVRFNQREVVGPLRIAVKAWYRHFPPEFLRLMARSTEALYLRAKALGKEREFFPHGPLMNEGENHALYPNAGNIDNVKRFMLDEAVKFVAVKSEQATHDTIKVPEQPTWTRDVAPIIADNCLPCHNDILRHGRLVMAYDKYPQLDDPKRGPKLHAAQDAVANLVNKSSFFFKDRKLVVPGDPGASYLLETLTEESNKVRRMPLKFDKLSDRDIAVIRKWIETGAQR
jgi:hypothetical protein